MHRLIPVQSAFSKEYDAYATREVGQWGSQQFIRVAVMCDGKYPKSKSHNKCGLSFDKRPQCFYCVANLTVKILQERVSKKKIPQLAKYTNWYNSLDMLTNISVLLCPAALAMHAS